MLLLLLPGVLFPRVPLEVTLPRVLLRLVLLLVPLLVNLTAVPRRSIAMAIGGVTSPASTTVIATVTEADPLCAASRTRRRRKTKTPR